MGSLLSLNIKRDVIGDILVEESCFFVISELKDFIKNELTKIGNHTITLTEIEPSNLSRTIKLDEQQSFIDSLRLDLVVSKLTRKSRSEANMMIDNDFIKVNHLVVNKATKTLKENDVVSIRKYGRFVLLDTSKKSKKDKIILKYGKFV